MRIFNANDVKYLVIGGFAVIQYAEPRFTKDLDLWIRTDPNNAKAVFAALKEFGAPLASLKEADFTNEGYFYKLGIPPIRVDIMMGIPGGDFDICWRNRNEVDFDGLMVTFISRKDLLNIKRTSGRPQDLIDADLLARIEKY